MSPEISSSSFLPYTLFPQVLRPRLKETRIPQLNNRIFKNTFVMYLYSEMVEVFVGNFNTKNLSILRGIYKLRVP